MVINIKCNKLAQAVPVEICEPFPNIKILFLEGGRGAIWQSTIDKVQGIISVFFWRKNATENFQSFCFLRVESRILMTVSTFYVEEFQILVILSFKLKTCQINGNKTLTDIQNFLINNWYRQINPYLNYIQLFTKSGQVQGGM